ncbi:MAG: tetratricopeptide repeat protein [Clostridia bacterium]|nr:tetratricopeptide repeat protein [Clostridia bacterium]
MSVKLRIVLLVVIAAAVIGILVYAMISQGSLNWNTVLKTVVVLAGLAASIIKVITHQKPSNSLSLYEKQYSDIIGTAFKNSASDRKCLLKVARCYAEDNLKKGITKANELWKNCRTVDDQKAVGVFKALILTDLGDEQGASEVYEYLVNDLGIRNDTVYSNLGLLYSKAGDYENAVKLYMSATEINPKNASTWTNAAFTFVRNLEIDKSIECAEKAIKLDGRMYNAYEVLAAAYTYKSDKELADKYYRMAVANGANKTALKAFIKRYEPDES